MANWIKDTTRREWRIVYRTLRKSGTRLAENHGGVLAEREAFAAHVRRVAEDGHVCVVESGMDCDCASFAHGRIEPAQPLRLWLDRERAFEQAEGPLSVYCCRPSAWPEASER